MLPTVCTRIWPYLLVFYSYLLVCTRMLLVCTRVMFWSWSLLIVSTSWFSHGYSCCGVSRPLTHYLETLWARLIRWSVWQPNPIELPEFDWFQFKLSTEPGTITKHSIVLDWLDFSLRANVFDCKTQSKSIQRLGWNFFFNYLQYYLQKYTIHYHTTYTTILPFAVPFAHTEREKKKEELLTTFVL